MKQINKSILIYGDVSYNYAVNYRHMYNAPITLNYGDKHNRKKYILSAGNSDHIELWQDGCFIYVLSQNNGLEYIALQIINTETEQIEDNIFLQGEDAADIIDLESEAQIKNLLQYAI